MGLIVLIVWISNTFVANAWAAKAAEIYPAIEQSEVSPEAAPPAAETPAQTPPTPTPPPTVTSEREPPYDSVPNHQLASFHRRLQLADLLLRQHNRAYDYRVLTIKQLEKLVHDLNSQKAVKTESSTQRD
jgi:hypothetical protein